MPERPDAYPPSLRTEAGKASDRNQQKRFYRISAEPFLLRSRLLRLCQCRHSRLLLN